MKEYYFLRWEERDELTSAFVEEAIKRLDHELISDLDNVNILPFKFDLRKVSVKENQIVESRDLTGVNNIWVDYQPNNLAWPLMSEKLKFLIADNLTGKEGIKWIFAKVHGIHEVRNYYIPRFEKKLDVLNFEKTVYVKGTDHIIKPCFAINKILAYTMFYKPSSHNLWRITPLLCVSEKLKKSIEENKLTGIEFKRATVV